MGFNEYVLKSIVIKTIIKKTTGSIGALPFDSGETITEKITPFDTFIQIIDRVANVSIDDNILYSVGWSGHGYTRSFRVCRNCQYLVQNGFHHIQGGYEKIPT